jgi:flagellar hook-length control protein FliK
VRESPSLATAVPATAHVDAPVESPEFAHELAARVSVLARDGVQRAELRLHPVELGPVAVQIALDGTQARVDFGAEMLVTRSAIEASLPALAASLRDAGLTLSGGGVSQQMPGQAQRQDAPAFDGSGPRGPGGRPEEPVVSGVTRALRHVRAGGVDLYA